MSIAVSTESLTVRYGKTTALDDVTVSLQPGLITGVLGRNGAGKSTLLATLAAYRRPTSGTVRLDGEDPFEHARLMAETCLVRQDKGFDPSMTVREAFDLVASFRPRWDRRYGEHLLDRFEVSPSTKLRALSTGKRAAVVVSVGLASRAPLTIFDEPQLGMDAPSRYAFYEEMLADYTENPRTILVSTHLIDEVATLLEDVVILHEGRLLMHKPVEDLRGIGAELAGPASAVDAITAGFEVHAERALGGVKSVVIFDTLDQEQRMWLAEAGVDVGPLPLQDVFVHLTSKEHADERIAAR